MHMLNMGDSVVDTGNVCTGHDAMYDLHSEITLVYLMA